MDLRLAGPALAAWLVAWQGRLVPPLWLSVAALALVVVGAGVLLVSRAWAAPLVAGTLACAAAAGLATAARVHSRTTGPLADAARAQSAVTVEGVLVDDPREVPPKKSVLAFRPLVAARLRVERLEVAGRTYRTRQTVLVLTSEDGWLGLLPSQHVRAEGRLKDPGRGSDVAAVMSARTPQLRGPPSFVQRVAGRLRSGLLRASAGLPHDERGLLPGLVDGDTSRLDAQLKDDFRLVGLTHLVAVSGTNVAVVLAAALLVCGWLGVPRQARAPVAGLVLVGFVVLARPSPSVLRAAAMGVIALLALATGSRRQALPALCAAVLGLVMLSPEIAAQPGFALSTLATAGLLVVAPVWRERLARRLPEWLAEALAVPAAAQLVCTPVVVALSGQLGLLAVPANLLAVPSVAPATVLGVLAALVAPVWLPAAKAFAWLAWLPTHWLVVVAHVGARQPGAGVSIPSGWTGAAIALVLIGCGAVVARSPQLRRATAAVVAGSLVALLVLVAIRPGWPPRGWVLASCDVGQGDGFAIRLGPTAAVVVDSGPKPEPIDRCLRRLGIHQVPLLVLTHLHADHVEGVPGLLRGRRVGAVEIGPLDEPAVERVRLLGWLAARRIPVLRAQIGETRSVGEVRWTVLDATARHGTDSDPNNSSIVLRLETHGVRVLFAGDLEGDAQRELLERGTDLRAEILKVPHHGSAKQDPDFLDAVHASVALTPVGANNPYGHPAASTLKRLEDDGARTYRSDKDGDVAVVVKHGRVTTVGRGGDGVGPSATAADHHGPTAAAPVTSATFRLGVPPSELTRCDVVPTRARGAAPDPRGRSPPYGQEGAGTAAKHHRVRRSLTALSVAAALVGGALALPSSGATRPAWQRYPRPAVTGKQIADWDIGFANQYVGRVTATPQQLLAGQALVDELTGLGYSVTVEGYAGVLQAVTATKRGTKHPEESIVMGAHFDTLPQSVYGTYDNASGSAMVMALARSFAKVKTQRTMVFSFYNGEEEGALASDQQAKAYKDAKRKISAYLGFDMVGIAWPVGGTATDKNCLCMWRGPRDEDVEGLLAEVNYRFLRFPNNKRAVSIEGNNIRNSDEESWATAGFRTLRWAGLRAAADYPQYHMPLDNPDTVDSVAGGRTYFEAGLRNTLLSAYYTAAALDTGR